jgi:hypothetical protein
VVYKTYLQTYYCGEWRLVNPNGGESCGFPLLTDGHDTECTWQSHLSFNIIRHINPCRTTLMLDEFCHFFSTDVALRLVTICYFLFQNLTSAWFLQRLCLRPTPHIYYASFSSIFQDCGGCRLALLSLLLCFSQLMKNGSCYFSQVQWTVVDFTLLFILILFSVQLLVEKRRVWQGHLWWMRIPWLWSSKKCAALLDSNHQFLKSDKAHWGTKSNMSVLCMFLYTPN